MTPLEIETAARRRYNSVGDDFWTPAEMFELIYQAEMEMALECRAIENAYTVSTVASTQAYAWPSQALAIKRVTYEGAKLDIINMREDDAITLINSSTVDTGTPSYYFLWENAIYLRPTPSAVGTLKIWTYDYPQTVTTTSTLDVPAQYHPCIVNFILSAMAMKDSNTTIADRYRALWEIDKKRITKDRRRRLRGDSPAHINDINSLPTSGIGNV